MNLLIILLILKLCARINIFKYIEGKYEQHNTKLATKIEKQCVKRS